MRKKKNLWWISLMFVLGAGILNWSEAKTKWEVEQKLRETHQSYSQKDYSRSKDILTYLAEFFPDDPHFSYFEFMIAKCEYHLENYQSAYRKFEDFMEKFPRSRFIPACHFMLGNIDYIEDKRFGAAQDFVLAYQKAKDDELKELAIRSIEPLLEEKLSEKEVDQLAQQNKDKKLAPSIFFWLGKRKFESKDYHEAREALSYYRDNFPNGTDIQEVSHLLERLSYPTSQILKVGVLTPLTGDYSNYGESMLKGINLALQYSFMQTEVELVVKDTEGDPIKGTSLSKELIEDDEVISIIGPLKSESTMRAGMAVGEAQIPLISPTASQEGIGDLNEFVFQLSPSSQTRGKSLAEFVIRAEKLVDFVVLVSDDQEAREFAIGFQEEAQQLGAKIMALEHFYEETMDFTPLLSTIKRVLLEKPPSDYVSEEEELFINELPIKVDGFLIAGGKEQMLRILPQISFLKIKTIIIGTEGCGNSEVLNLAQNLNQELIFSSDIYHLPEDQTWRSFSALYYNKYKEEPDRVAALGFDAMNLLISIFEKGITSPEKIKDSLVQIKNFNGASGTIRFDQHRENQNISILNCQKGKVERLR
jgi:branched-chain amino acid transport system substrate-binding protein